MWKPRLLNANLLVFNLSDDIEAPLSIYTAKLNLKDDSFLYDPPFILKNADGEIRSISVRYNHSSTSDCDLSRPLFFTHQVCWKIVRQLRPHFTCYSLYKIAQATQPITALDLHQEASQRSLDSFPGDVCNFSKATSLGKILRRCDSLPCELQQEIRQHLSGDLTATLLSAARNSMPFLHQLVDPGPTPSMVFKHLLPDGAAGDEACLCWTTIVILGQAYLRRVEVSEMDRTTVEIETGELSGTMRIRISNIRGIKFVLGTYGLRSISIIYQNGSTSPWLGEPGQGGWYGRIDGLEPRRLHVVQDVSGISSDSPTLWRS